MRKAKCNVQKLAILAALAVPALLIAVVVAERMAWGPFAPPEPQPAKAESTTPRQQGFDLDDYRPRRVIDRLLPPIVAADIPLRKADDLAGEVTDDELVLGVEIDGEARAYPINQLHLPLREVFNDTLGGRPIAATW
jgi:hypothetical protein